MYPENYIDDDELYKMYPHHRKWFNKLYIAEKMGYKCGPSGLAPEEDGVYVVRPIYNLTGMGVGAEVKEIKAGDCSKVPPGYFWCEYFKGKHYSATYRWEYDRDNIWGTWKQPWKGQSCWEGINYPINLTKFVEWKRSEYIPPVPDLFVALRDVKIINIEFINDNPIEVHLRDSPNPKYDHLIPTWVSDQVNGKMMSARHDHMIANGYTWIEAPSDGDGFLKDKRTGFWCK